jgi:integrase/recombinase XerD
MSKFLTQPFPVLLQKFFTQRLLLQQHVSHCTVTAYRDSFRLLLAFAYQRLHKRPSNIAIEDLNASFILAAPPPRTGSP